MTAEYTIIFPFTVGQMVKHITWDHTKHDHIEGLVEAVDARLMHDGRVTFHVQVQWIKCDGSLGGCDWYRQWMVVDHNSSATTKEAGNE